MSNEIKTLDEALAEIEKLKKHLKIVSEGSRKTSEEAKEMFAAIKNALDQTSRTDIIDALLPTYKKHEFVYYLDADGFDY